MVKIVSENKKATKHLERVIKTLKNNGAYFDEDIEVRVTENGMSVHSPEKTDKRILVKIPHDLLLPRDSFLLGVHKGGFKLIEYDPSLSRAQVSILKDLVHLYNATNQLQAYNKTSPWITYRDRPAILEKLVKARPESHTKSNLKETLADPETFIINNFLNARLLKCKLNKPYRPAKAVLMPFIDCFNHTNQGAAYSHDYEQDPAYLYMKYASPLNTDECFASYGKYDGLDTFLYYGFYDHSSTFIRSVPLNLELSNGVKISIDSAHSITKAKDLPEDMKDLAFYMPAVKIDKARKTIDISTLYIPSDKAPLSLRRVLKFILNTYNPDMTQKGQADMVLIIENQVLKANTIYYQELSTMSASEGENDLITVANQQLLKLKEYQQNLINKLKALKAKNIS